ncbi:hypothetical protein EU524_01700, partial [Candidatus Thorarchaeota archaeon]
GLLYLVEVFLAIAEEPGPKPELENIWRILLFNQDHNILRGTIADQPYLLAKRRYDQAIEKAQNLLEETVGKVASKVKQLEGGQSYAVFNPSSWLRTDVVRVPLSQDVGGASHIVVEDSDGTSVLCQVLRNEDAEGPPEVLFLAEDVPSLGYRAFTIKESDEKPQYDTSLRVGKDWMESKSTIVEFDGFNGTLTRLYDKRNQFELLTANANCLTLETDVGDLYRSSSSDLSGEDSVITSLRSSAKIRMIERGPLRSVAEVTTNVHSFPVRQLVTIYEGIPRIDLETHIDFKGQDTRATLRFPLSVFTNEVTVGAQFTAEDRHLEVSCPEDRVLGGAAPFPALDWVDCSGPDNGVMLSVPGVHEFQFKDGVLAFTLFRSVDHLSRGLDDDNKVTTTAVEKGHHSYRYCISSHHGDWRDGDVWRISHEHRLPLIAYPLDDSSRGDTVEGSMLRINGNELMITCFKPTQRENEYIIRFYEPKGESGKSELSFSRVIQSVRLVDLCEKDVGELTFSGNRVEIPIDAYSIVTLRVSLGDELQ